MAGSIIRRDEFMRNIGSRVLRFSDREVFENIEGVKEGWNPQEIRKDPYFRHRITNAVAEGLNEIDFPVVLPRGTT